MARRRNFIDQFKAKVALEALRGDKTIQEIAAHHQVHPNQVSTWKRQAVRDWIKAVGGQTADIPASEVLAGPPVSEAMLKREGLLNQ